MTHVHSTEEQICIKSCGHTEKKRTCFPHENMSGVHLYGAVILALYSAHETHLECIILCPPVQEGDRKTGVSLQWRVLRQLEAWSA